MKSLGLDYGSKRIGVAFSDEGGSFAFPHSILSNDEDAIETICMIVKKEAAEEIVLGESLSQTGSANVIMDAVHAFKQELEGCAGVPVVFEKEFFTSVEARRMQGGGAGVDASAAALILQRYLDRKNKNA